MRHDHVSNGIAPVKGCAICDLIVKGARRDAKKEPEGRLPPWHWTDNKEDS